MASRRAVTERHDRTEYAGQHLSTDEESEGKVHVRGSKTTQGSQDEDANGAEQGVVLPRAETRQPSPAWSALLQRHRCGGHGKKAVKDWEDRPAQPWMRYPVAAQTLGRGALAVNRPRAFQARTQHCHGHERKQKCQVSGNRKVAP